MWLKVAEDFSQAFPFCRTIVTGDAEEVEFMSLFADYTFVEGGASRQESLANALNYCESEYILVNDVARCCLDLQMLQRVLHKAGEADCVVPVLEAVDTMYEGDRLLDRSRVRMVQTPQLSRREILQKAIEKGEFTDESSAIAAYGGTLLFVEGSRVAHKLTRYEDTHRLPCLEAPSSIQRSGIGIDTHPFQDGRRMYLCGVEIEAEFGFRAHSDGDVALHALTDAILGAAGMGDIGEHFPDSDSRYAGADSALLLEEAVSKIRRYGLDIHSCDITIVAEVPRLSPYKREMRRRVADILGIGVQRVNIKATTSEGMGFIGRGEGVSVYAVATIGYFDWTKGESR